ncbi:MAG: STAS domain-containing protein [Clostridium sp.]|nr:STAS domain-containing protein [Clostridium sp.]MCM1444255.1 STAS domain-containing protein [Candidatus Amulumruptor caecigallinarius]
MLDIQVEFRKGILFIRLSGILNKTTVPKLNEEVTDMIKDNGIRNVVFNMSEVTNIDIKGINALFFNYELCNQNKGKILLCGINSLVREKIINSRLLKYMGEIQDELSALECIGI